MAQHTHARRNNGIITERYRPVTTTPLADSGFGTGKGSSSSNSQNRIMSSDAALFTTRNNTRVIAQRGGLAVLPCAVKWNPTATVRNIRFSARPCVYRPEWQTNRPPALDNRTEQTKKISRSYIFLPCLMCFCGVQGDAG